MSKDPSTLPIARHWRDIPQRVKPRAMSREGKRRLVGSLLRAMAGAAALGVVGWAGWQVSAALRGNVRALPAELQGEPVRQVRLETDGVLDQAWINHALALPKNATLMSLSLERLRDRILAGGQVQSVALVREFPATLVVRMGERSPVARLQAQGTAEPFLVARDGVVYRGSGYDPAMTGSLPWLDGIALRRQGAGFAPIEGMEAVAELLAVAKREAAPLYQSWRVVSLARLASDGEIDVRTRDGLTVIFGTQENVFRQLGKLDLMLDVVRAHPERPVREINLALGPRAPVPVSFGANAAPVASAPAARPAAPSSLFSFPSASSPSRTREF